jgi:nickel-dependent lactate racemase
MVFLRYGQKSSVELEFAEDIAVGEAAIPRGQPLADLDAVIKNALAKPIDYPTLAESTTPADHVVLALDRAVPQVAQITAVVVRTLVEAGVDPDGITILQNPIDIETNDDDPRRWIDAPLRERITHLIHDPEDRRQLAYLAANESAEAILVNRVLHEADVVLPIGCIRAEETAGYFGIHSAVFPAFSDTKTIHRFRGLGLLNGQGKHHRELLAEVDNVGWLLGVNFTIQVVPAAGDGVLHVLAGQTESVRRQGQQRYRAAWSCPPADRVDLVVAGIEGGAAQQTWENLGRALSSAGNFVTEGGSIVVCSELAAQFGPALQRMAAASSHESALRHVGKERPVDALPAAQIAHALQQNKVYLLSRLDPSRVEDLNIIPIAGADELNRLARQHQSCILLSNAPYLTVVQ